MVQEILLDAQELVDARLLKDDAQSAPDGVGVPRHVVTEHACGTPRWLQKRRQDLEERALAAAVRPEEAEDLAARDREREAIERDPGTVTLPQLV